MGKYQDLAGRKFGKLTVIERAKGKYKNDTHACWLCRCDCGNETVESSTNLKSGKVKSCGCMKHNYGHGMTGTKLHKEWVNIKQRCYNSNNKNYIRYGGKGVEVCADWRNKETGFANFYDWACENGYKDGLEIDRIDNNGNYEPSNCRWTDRKTQMNNTSRNKILSYNGKSQTMAEWARELEIDYHKLNMRIYRGWSIEKALNTP